MSTFHQTLGGTTYRFEGIVDLLAKASPLRSGDELAGLGRPVGRGTRRRPDRARRRAAGLRFLEEQLVPYESDEVSRLIVDAHDPAAFAPFLG